MAKHDQARLVVAHFIYKPSPLPSLHYHILPSYLDHLIHTLCDIQHNSPIYRLTSSMMLDTHPILMLTSILTHAQPCNDPATMRILQELARKPEIDLWTLLDTCEVSLLSPTLVALQTQCSLFDKPLHRVASTLTCLKGDIVPYDNSSALLSCPILDNGFSSSYLGGSNISVAHHTSGISSFGTLLPVLLFCLLAYSLRPSSGKLYSMMEGALTAAKKVAKVAYDKVFILFMWFTLFVSGIYLDVRLVPNAISTRWLTWLRLHSVLVPCILGLYSRRLCSLKDKNRSFSSSGCPSTDLTSASRRLKDFRYQASSIGLDTFSYT